MSKPIVVSARLTEDQSMLLDVLGRELDRSRAWLVGEAVRRYIDEETAVSSFVREGDEAIERGDYRTQEQMEAWVEQLGRAAKAA